MSDFKAHIKIKMEFMTIKDETDMSINYGSGEVEGVDDRVIEFFRNVYEKGMHKYNVLLNEHFDKKREEEERALYFSLKEKYGGRG